jgi:ADP-ribose pyrophosphatase
MSYFFLNTQSGDIAMKKRIAALIKFKKNICAGLAILTSFTCHGIETKPASVGEKPLSSSESPTRLYQYLRLLQDHSKAFGPLGSWRKGEIEIVVNPDQIQRIENQVKHRLISKGIAEKTAENWSTVGIVAEDNYWMWIRDAVIFPSGVYGTYDRMMWKSGMDGVPGVAILPILGNKKIVVNLNYRHATRSWEIELPRGQKNQGETLEHAALRELQEETGYHLSKSFFLGTIAPDSGVQMSVVPLYYGEVSHSGESKKEYSEAISQNPAFSKQELKEGFIKGFIEMPIHGELIQVNCRDPFLIFAMVLAEGKGIL